MTNRRLNELWQDQRLLTLTEQASVAADISQQLRMSGFLWEENGLAGVVALHQLSCEKKFHRAPTKARCT
jgi:hypothetical protein